MAYCKVGPEVSAALHPARPPKNARCHHWTSFHVSEKRKFGVSFSVRKWNYPEMVLFMIYFSLYDEVKTRQHPFYPFSLLPLTQRKKVLLCACVETFLYLNAGNTFGSVGTELCGFRKQQFLIVAHLIISKKVLMISTTRTTLHRLFLLASYVYKATRNIHPTEKEDLYFQII